MKKILTFLFILPLAASAQQLSLDECRELALQYNKDKQSAQLTTQQATLTLKSMKTKYLPDFSLTALGLYDTGEGSLGLGLNQLKEGLAQAIQGGVMSGALTPQMGAWMGQVGAQVPDRVNVDFKMGFMYGASLLMKQPLYMGGKIRAGVQMSQWGVEMARQQERLTDAEVIQRVNEAYANCVKANEMKVVAEKYKVLLDELERNVQSAVRHGLRMKNDVTKVQVRLNEVELKLRRAENAQRLAMMNLCHLVGQPLTAQLTVSSMYPAVSDAQTLLEADVTQRPEYVLLDYQARMAGQQVRLAKSELLPQVALLAKYGYAHGVKVADDYLLDGLNFAAGITVNVPLYHFGERQQKVKKARVQQQQAELERDNKAELMQLEITRAANNLDEARLEVQLCDRSLEQAEESMQLSRQQYEAGVEPLSDYLEAQALWQQAWQSQVDARFQLYLQSVAYLKACGRLVE